MYEEVQALITWHKNRAAALVGSRIHYTHASAVKTITKLDRANEVLQDLTANLIGTSEQTRKLLRLCFDYIDNVPDDRGNADFINKEKLLKDIAEILKP